MTKQVKFNITDNLIEIDCQQHGQASKLMVKDNVLLLTVTHNKSSSKLLCTKQSIELTADDVIMHCNFFVQESTVSKYRLQAASMSLHDYQAHNIQYYASNAIYIQYKSFTVL